MIICVISLPVLLKVDPLRVNSDFFLKIVHISTNAMCAPGFIPLNDT